MQLKALRDPESDERTYTLTVTMQDLQEAHFYKWDHELLRECNDETASIADKLLGLELLARRIEQGKAEHAAIRG